MAKILKVRADFIRVAHAFCYGVTGVFDSAIKQNTLSEASRSVYIEPHPSGEGVRIVSTDGCAICIQWDRKGYVDRPRLLSGLTHCMVLDFSGTVLDDRWIEATATDSLTLTRAGKTDIPLAATNVYKAWANVKGDGTQFPPFGQYVIEPENLHNLTRGFPGELNCAYLTLIGRLYEDGLQNVRTVRVYSHNGDTTLPVVLHFPWRDYTTVVLAPMKDNPKAWKDVLTDPVMREMAMSDNDDDL